MADIITNECMARLGSGLLAWQTNTVVACLFSGGATFNADSAAYASTYELPSANGYTQLNKAVESKTVTLDNANDEIMYDCADLTWTASGGDIGPAEYCAFVDTQGGANKYLYIIDFGSAKTANTGTDFKITIDTSGLFRSVQG